MQRLTSVGPGALNQGDYQTCSCNASATAIKNYFETKFMNLSIDNAKLAFLMASWTNVQDGGYAKDILETFINMQNGPTGSDYGMHGKLKRGNRLMDKQFQIAVDCEEVGSRPKENSNSSPDNPEVRKQNWIRACERVKRLGSQSGVVLAIKVNTNGMHALFANDARMDSNGKWWLKTEESAGNDSPVCFVEFKQYLFHAEITPTIELQASASGVPETRDNQKPKISKYFEISQQHGQVSGNSSSSGSSSSSSSGDSVDDRNDTATEE